MAYSMLIMLLAVCTAVFATPLAQTGLSDTTIARVRANLRQIAVHSWEVGTELETLIELEWPQLSVFHKELPPPTQLRAIDNARDVVDTAMEIVRNISSPGGPLVDGQGSVGDPASVGVPVLLANWTRTNLSDETLSVAATNQLNYLLYDAPRTEDGAISHRVDRVQIWADFVYMAPPFMAYYGALQGGDQGVDLMKEAYRQCKLYRQYLRDAAGNGLWQHIVLGDWQDYTHWGTGNAWAAAGMLRVLETIRRSDSADDLLSEQTDLTAWINEILKAAWKFQHWNGTLFNWIDQPYASFPDSSSTALLAAVTFRMATFTGKFDLIPAADKAFNLIKESLTPNGWLLNTVNPLTFNTPSPPGDYSPEGQAFVLLLQAAWRDFNAMFGWKFS